MTVERDSPPDGIVAQPAVAATRSPLRAAWLLTAAICLMVLAFAEVATPVTAPWSGDTGIRLLQTDVLRETGDLAVPYLGQPVDPGNRWNPLSPRYFTWQNGRYYPKFSLAYAYLGAGLSSAFGPGWLLVPSVVGLAISALAVWWALAQAGSRLALLGPAVVGLLSPVSFYAAEYWEHSLATGLATLGAAGLFAAGIRGRTGPAALAGACLGIGLWLRGELYAYVPAVGTAFLLVFGLWNGAAGWGRAALMSRVRAVPWRALTATVAGLLLVAAPLWWYQQRAYGSAEGAHVAVDSPLVLRGQSNTVIVERMLRQWGDTIPGLVIPQGPAAGWAVAALALAVAAFLLWKGNRFGPAAFFAASAIFTVLALANFALRLAPVDLVVSFPAGLLLLLVAGRRPAGLARTALMFFSTAALLYVLASVFTAPSSGGAQHGPRYLLSVYPLWTVCLVLAVEPWLARPWPRLVAAAGALLLLASLLTQLVGFRNLKVIKEQYAEIGAVSASLPAGPIVTDLWWYPQVTPNEVRHRPVFLLNDPKSGPDLVAALKLAGVTQMTFVTSEETGPVAALADGLRVIGEGRITPRKLVFRQYALS